MNGRKAKLARQQPRTSKRKPDNRVPRRSRIRLAVVAAWAAVVVTVLSGCNYAVSILKTALEVRNLLRPPSEPGVSPCHSASSTPSKPVPPSPPALVQPDQPKPRRKGSRPKPSTQPTGS